VTKCGDKLKFKVTKMKKQKQSLLIQVWESYEFYLYIPDNVSRNNKPFIFYYYKDVVTDRSVRIRRFLGQNKGDKKMIQVEAVIAIKELIVLLAGNYNPIKKTYNDLKISPLSSIEQCMQHWELATKTALFNNSITPRRLKTVKIGLMHLQDYLKKQDLLNLKPSVITSVHIKQYLDAKAYERNWGKVSYNCYRTDINTFFNYLLDLKIIDVNPVKKIAKKSTKHDSSRFRVYELEELKRVAELLAEDNAFLSLYTASKILFKYNIRPLEMTRLQVIDINWDKQLLTLPANKTKNGNEATFLLDEETVSLLKLLVKDAPLHFYIFCARNKPSATQTFDDYLGQRWRAFRVKHHLPPHLKFYALKHSSNYYDIENGVGYEEIRQRNRHSNLQVTTLYIKERLFKNIIKPTSFAGF
jgi:integrase